MPAYQSQSGGIPGPWLDVIIISRDGADRRVLGILDTGADQTQVPESVAAALRLRPIGHRTFTNANGSSSTSRTYVADVEFDGRRYRMIEVAGSPLRIALIGRDILNSLVAEFDGPANRYDLR